jgi:hypothetical protein
MVPNWSVPVEDPNPEPVIVICVPEAPEAGVTDAMWGVLELKGTELLQTPFCRICAYPEAEPGATVAITCASLQLTTEA